MARLKTIDEMRKVLEVQRAFIYSLDYGLYPMYVCVIADSKEEAESLIANKFKGYSEITEIAGAQRILISESITKK